MKKEACFYLGKIVRKYSFKGEVLAKLDVDDPSVYEGITSVFIALSESLVPFVVQQSSLHKSNLLRIRFKDFHTEVQATRLLGSELYLPLSMLPERTGTHFYFHEVIGFGVRDTVHGEVGVITGIHEATAQPLFQVQKAHKQWLIPITNTIVKEVDRTRNEIRIAAPEGLLDLYVNCS